MSDPTYVRSTLDNLRHGNFDPDAEPVATVADGDELVVETISPYSPDLLTDRGVPPSEILADERVAVEEGERNGPGPHVVTGPIAIENASPGDVLEVAVRGIDLRTSYGVNSFEPGVGVLSEAFSDRHISVIRLERDRGVAAVAAGIDVPLDPFFGIMAVAPPADRGRVSTTPPACYGGNLDIQALTAGSTLYLPVQTEGGRFFLGDGHAAQGNGEVDSTAIETSLTGRFTVRLHEDAPGLTAPVAETPDAYIVVGIDETLDGAIADATEEAISFLVAQHGIAADVAYRVCSIAVDFNVSQAVNGNVGIHGRVPKAIFTEGRGIEPSRFDGSTRWRGS